MGFIVLILLIVVLGIYATHVSLKSRRNQEQQQQTANFDLLDDNGGPIKTQKTKIIINGGSDAPVKELQYFCVKDKGYHVSVWPKNHDRFDVVEFSIAGLSHRENIDNYLGEFVGILMEEPDNPYDPNAIKILAGDGHHVGYVPKDMTDEVRKESTVPCPCFFYIGKNDENYFSDCYVLRK